MAVTRKLVTVRRIEYVIPISGTPFVTVKIGGWRVVVNSNEGFREGQLVVYFEIDSILPNTGYFWEFCVRNNAESDGKPVFLVGTVMKSKHISQGLVFHLDTFSEVTSVFNELKSKYRYDEALQRLMDRSFEKELGVEKWEAPQDEDHRIIGPAPVFFPQPGCLRAQNIFGLFDEEGEKYFHVTEKLDGVPMTIYCINKNSEWCSTLPALPEHLQQEGPLRIGISGRRDDLLEHVDSWFWTTAKQQGMLDKIKRVTNEVKNVAIQGELCGSSIHTNSMGFAPDVHHFYAFDIFDIDRQKYLKPYNAATICGFAEIDYAPVIRDRVKLSTFATDIDNLVAKAEGRGLLGKPREGLVFKEVNGGFTFKVISNSWLLQTGKGQ